MNNRPQKVLKDADMADFDLQSERFALRPARMRHLDDLEGILSDPDVVKMLLGDASTPQGVAKEAAKWIDDPGDWTRLGYGSWGIFDRTGELGDADRLLGIAAASPSLAGLGEGPEIFYFVKRACWGKGIAGEAVTRMCGHLFDSVQVQALEASIFAELNPGSVRLAQKLGMRPAGRVSLRSHGLDDERIQEIVSFDLWRVRTAPVERVHDALAEASFRIGQTLAEGFRCDEHPPVRAAGLTGRARPRPAQPSLRRCGTDRPRTRERYESQGIGTLPGAAEEFQTGTQVKSIGLGASFVRRAGSVSAKLRPGAQGPGGRAWPCWRWRA